MLIKKSGTYDTSNRLYGRKHEKVWIFEDQLQKWGWEAMGYLSTNPNFFTENFFQWFWETFLYVVWLCSSYLRDCLNIVLYLGKKIRNVRHVKQIILQETRKSLHFYFENGVEKLWGYPSKTTILESKLFFRKLLENFLFIARPCFIYLKGAPNIVLYVNKKIGTVRHTNQKIFTKPRKIFPLYHCRRQPHL